MHLPDMPEVSPGNYRSRAANNMSRAVKSLIVTLQREADTDPAAYDRAADLTRAAHGRKVSSALINLAAKPPLNLYQEDGSLRPVVFWASLAELLGRQLRFRLAEGSEEPAGPHTVTDSISNLSREFVQTALVDPMGHSGDPTEAVDEVIVAALAAPMSVASRSRVAYVRSGLRTLLGDQDPAVIADRPPEHYRGLVYLTGMSIALQHTLHVGLETPTDFTRIG